MGQQQRQTSLSGSSETSLSPKPTDKLAWDESDSGTTTASPTKPMPPALASAGDDAHLIQRFLATRYKGYITVALKIVYWREKDTTSQCGWINKNLLQELGLGVCSLLPTFGVFLSRLYS